MRVRVLGVVLAGGKGTRLYPLTKERAKPAVPFGGKYRIIDFVLSNFINSGIYSLYVLTQFRSQSLLQHLNEGAGNSATCCGTSLLFRCPRRCGRRENWLGYPGTREHAIYQNINLLEQAKPDVVAIFGADHIYRMNIASMVEFHEGKKAAATVAAIPVDKSLAREFGVIETDDDGRIVGFHEKKADAPTIPGDPTRVYASMGNYIFATNTLLRELADDVANEDSSHDFGRDILPSLITREAVYAYDFQTNKIPGERPEDGSYWRDVGTIDAYYEANMDLKAVKPALNLYNRQWPLRTSGFPDPPAKFTFDDGKPPWLGNRFGGLGGDVSCRAGTVRNSVLARGVKVHAGAVVEDSIILDNCDIGRRAQIRRAILDKNVRIQPDTRIGFDLEADRKRYHVTESGIVVVEGNRSPVDVVAIDV